MTPLPLGKPILPISPTEDEHGNPTVCKACGRVAMGIGRGTANQRGQQTDAGFLCKGCLVAVSDLSKFDRLSLFELKALDAGVEAVGEWIDQNGGVTDLQCFDDLMQRMLVKAATVGLGLRTVWRAEITDEALSLDWAYARDPARFTALVLDMANEAVRGGARDIPGVRAVDEKRAA